MATARIREELPRIVRDLGVRTLLDAPCGDFHWMRHVELGCRYVGVDIVQELVEQNRQRYARPDRVFLHGDITQGPLPSADLVLCRDCLFHLSDDQVIAALRQFAACGAQWLLATTYPSVTVNKPGITGGYRDLNLCRPPFSLAAPRELITEGEMLGTTTVGAARAIGLWSADDLPVVVPSAEA